VDLPHLHHFVIGKLRQKSLSKVVGFGDIHSRRVHVSSVVIVRVGLCFIVRVGLRVIVRVIFGVTLCVIVCAILRIIVCVVVCITIDATVGISEAFVPFRVPGFFC
jgi:hypothetical protein